jgi:hypothetical protein
MFSLYLHKNQFAATAAPPPIIATYCAAIPQRSALPILKEHPLQYIPFVGEAPEVLVAFGDAAAALDDRARIELTAEAAAEEAATAAIEDASGRLGMDDSLRGAISERPISCAAVREVSRARARYVKETILFSFEG